MNKKIFLFSVIIIVSFSSLNKAQEFGFGCLGLSGFYGGLSSYKFDAPGLNQYANSYAQKTGITASNEWTDFEFTNSTGYRVGVNLFRAKWEAFFISSKLYYQFLKETQYNKIAVPSGMAKLSYIFSMNHWGGGIDLGVRLFSIFDWKIIEGHVNFYNGELIQEELLDDKLITETKFSSQNYKMGYFLGTGLIMNLVPGYISLEGTAGYSFIQMEEFTSESSGTIPLSKDIKAVNKGTLGITIQLNVGFPL